MTTQQMHADMIQRTADSLITTLSLLIPESGYSAKLDHTSYFTRYNMQGTTLMLQRKASIGAMLCDYERIYGEAHAFDAYWWELEDIADAAAMRLYPNPIRPVEQSLALSGLKREDEAPVKMFREVQRIATGDTDWVLSKAVLRPFFH